MMWEIVWIAVACGAGGIAIAFYQMWVESRNQCERLIAAHATRGDECAALRKALAAADREIDNLRPYKPRERMGAWLS